MNHPEWILTIGEIVAPFGLVGEMKVRLETDFPDRYSKLKQICIRRRDGVGSLYQVVSARQHKGQVLLKVQGITTIEGTEPLRNSLVQIRSHEAVRLPENEFYIHDLKGCSVVTLSGRVLGKLTDVLRGLANDVYVIGEGKDEILLPVVKDVVQNVDLEARTITVSPTPGLLPEETESEAEAEQDISSE